MIFIDTNVIVRTLVKPVTTFDVEMTARAEALFKHAEHGEIAITISDAIVAEVAYILTARSHYNAPRSVAYAGIKRILELSACRLPSKAICIKALELWALHPKLSFPDSLAAAYAELQRYELVTFDMALRALPSIAHYSFPAASSG